MKKHASWILLALLAGLILFASAAIVAADDDQLLAGGVEDTPAAAAPAAPVTPEVPAPAASEQSAPAAEPEHAADQPSVRVGGRIIRRCAKCPGPNWERVHITNADIDPVHGEIRGWSLKRTSGADNSPSARRSGRSRVHRGSYSGHRSAGRTYSSERRHRSTSERVGMAAAAIRALVRNEIAGEASRLDGRINVIRDQVRSLGTTVEEHARAIEQLFRNDRGFDQRLRIVEAKVDVVSPGPGNYTLPEAPVPTPPGATPAPAPGTPPAAGTDPDKGEEPDKAGEPPTKPGEPAKGGKAATKGEENKNRSIWGWLWGILKLGLWLAFIAGLVLGIVRLWQSAQTPSIKILGTIAVSLVILIASSQWIGDLSGFLAR